MTREKALQVDLLLYKIESYELLLNELHSLDTLQEVVADYSDQDLEDEILAAVQTRLDKALKELEEM